MSIAKLESLIGHTFRRPELISRALTHRSWAHENLPGASDEEIRDATNESMEFVGDSVLGLAIAEELFAKHPTRGEGDLTLMKHHLVSTATLAAVAGALDLGSHVRMGRGEDRTGGRKKSAILADTLEAVIAAVFFDSGYVSARALVRRIFADQLRAATPKDSLDYKTLLQETLQAKKLSAPTYALVRTEGQPHARTFFVEARWDSGHSEGTGRSIKAAEMVAAEKALQVLRDGHDPEGAKGKRKPKV
jgi:ribonuclease-3